MAIVRDAIEALGGSVTVNSGQGKGTGFQLRMPATITTYRGTFVEAGGETFILPTRNVVRAMRMRRDDIRTIENRPAVLVDGKATSLVDLAELLGLKPGTVAGADTVPIVVVQSASSAVALAVDAVLWDQEVLAKNLGSQLRHVSGVSGAAALPDGTLTVVLNCDEIVRMLSAGADIGVRTVLQHGAVESERQAAPRVLLVEDSITARVLLQTILETAGYEVTTAVDGADAFATLRTESFDIVVSDVDMPRMDGFELTDRIRKTEKYKGLPVVLVTARESRGRPRARHRCRR